MKFVSFSYNFYYVDILREVKSSGNIITPTLFVLGETNPGCINATLLVILCKSETTVAPYPICHSVYLNKEFSFIKISIGISFVSFYPYNSLAIVKTCRLVINAPPPVGPVPP